MKKTKTDPVRDEQLRTMILAGARAEATRLQRLIDEAGRDMPVSALAGPGEEFVIRVARVDGSVLLTSTIRHDASFLLFTGGGLLADVMRDRSLRAIVDLLEGQPELVGDTATSVDRDRMAAVSRLSTALARLPAADGSSPQSTAALAIGDEGSPARTAQEA